MQDETIIVEPLLSHSKSELILMHAENIRSAVANVEGIVRYNDVHFIIDCEFIA